MRSFEESTLLVCQEVSKEDHQKQKIKALSGILVEEARNMVPNFNDLSSDLGKRVGPLWVKYFSKGINLSTGGVSRSFLSLDDLRDDPRLSTFNMYDNYTDTGLSQAALKQFLYEESAIMRRENFDRLSVVFSFGAHEAMMRIARCVYRANYNDTIFFPTSSYGILAMSLREMLPQNYKIRLLDINREQGEKILFSSLLEEVARSSSGRTLFLELKTMAGAVYSQSELEAIISICRENKILLVVDASHANMHFSTEGKFPDVSSLCLKNNFYDFVILYSGSKTYGLERARVGFILLGQENQFLSAQVLEEELTRTLGTLSDLPVQVAKKLVNSDVSKRRAYIHASAETLRFNMNLMVAYVCGVFSKFIDDDLRDAVKKAIPLNYQSGIPLLTILYKPSGGMHLKIDTRGLKKKYFANIQVFNSEIFCYLLNIMANVVSLHSYCLLDPKGYSMRLSFSIREDVHNGMQAIHEFVRKLTDLPQVNSFMPDLLFNEAYVREKHLESMSRLGLFAVASSRYSGVEQKLTARL